MESTRPIEGDVTYLAREAPRFGRELTEIKHRLAPESTWYPYGALDNFTHLDRLLSGDHRDLTNLARGLPIADIGAADGDVAFFLAKHGFEVDILDWGPTNFNGLRGARLLDEHFDLPTTVHEVDLDSQFSLPRNRYGVTLLLGILYHLQNPFFALKMLSEHSTYLLLSTRIAAVTPDGSLNLQSAPLAYLVAPDELNGDATNYWIFSQAGLRQLAHRSGWDILDEMTAGCTDGTSDPASAQHDERAFLLMRSRTHQ